jgi:uncharacterized protein YraI
VRLFGILTCDLMTAVAPIVAATTVATATPEIYEIPTLTPEVTQPAPNDEPAATFLQNGNCRQGPGSNYPVITSFLQGDLLHVEGRDSAASWWYLLVPGSTGHCWAAGSNLQLTGPVEQAPVIAAPPTPTVAAPPPPPGKLVISDQVCSDQTYTVTLSWNDVDGNDGYRVFRDGNLIATLGANAASFTDSPPDSGPYTYGVEAFNGAGASSRPTVNEPGCVY